VHPLSIISQPPAAPEMGFTRLNATLRGLLLEVLASGVLGKDDDDDPQTPAQAFVQVIGR
jgi:hypothetical protein